MGEEGAPSSSSANDGPVELEQQFILRMPGTPAAILKSVVRSGVSNLKDRLSIQLDADMRHGKVRFDGWSLPSRVVDLPCIIESLKTLDRKNFYKTADISQIMICKEEADQDDLDTSGEGDGSKKKDKDKKFLWPHGITPPLKNCRKRRFRKTLKKKFVDYPEIEKEVKRLLKADTEAIAVRYEVVNVEDEEKAKEADRLGLNNESQSMDIAEHDIFGEVLSSSDDDEDDGDDTRPASLRRDSGEDEESRLSMMQETRDEGDMDNLDMDAPSTSKMSFHKGLLQQASSSRDSPTDFLKGQASAQEDDAAAVAALEAEQGAADLGLAEEQDNEIMTQIRQLEQEMTELQTQIQTAELELQNIENQALRNRFQQNINALKEKEADKKRQYDQLCMMVQ